ncbi:MAG: LamG-like jellyroll fold domain-containing protein, partial [Bdellovibrio sp.]
MFPLIKKAKLLLATGLVGLFAVPVGVVPGETIALWNFNESSGATVADQVSTGGAAPGTASANVQIVSAAALGTGFGSARNFSVAGSYIDLGEIAGTKLDRNNTNEAAVEAMIYLTAAVTTPVTIFDNKQIQLQVINNRLAGFVRQSSGYKGVLASTPLALNTAYRVGAHLKSGHLIISADGYVVGNVKIPEAIPAMEAGTRATIGGDVAGMNFLGIIDDVRFSNKAILDTIPPQVNLISPDISVSLVDAHPEFVFQITDNEDQIDEASFVVKLNGNVVSGLSFNSGTGILSGQLSAPLGTGLKNILEVNVKDSVGNPTTVQFEVKYINWGSGEEYETDEHTLGLWHLNDLSGAVAEDSSGNKGHGRYRGTTSVQGVLGQARFFSQLPTGYEEISLPPVVIPAPRFTFEAWVRPLSDQRSTGDIFNNDQISIQRLDNGSIRVNLKTYYTTYTYTSAAAALPLSKWSHVKVVYEGNLHTGNLIILVDG